MLRKILVVVAAVAISVFCLSGCKKGPGETNFEQEEMVETAAEYEEEVLKTSAEYQEDAQREIILENMEAELKKIEEELKRDLAEEK